jgi:hypothetical protein
VAGAANPDHMWTASGLDKVRAVFVFVFAVAAYNIVRLPHLLAAKAKMRPAA